MKILIITSNTELQERIKSFVQKHFGEASIIHYACDIDEAGSIIINKNPECILSNSVVSGVHILKLVDFLPANHNRNYFILNIDEKNAIKAIRLGVRGMFDFETEQARLVDAIIKINDTSSIKRLESKLKALSNNSESEKSIIVQTKTGFKEIEFANLLFVEYTNNKLHYSVKNNYVLESKHELFMVANSLPYKTFSVVTPNLIINSQNVACIKPESNGCLIEFNDNTAKHIPNMGLDTLFRMIKDTQII